MSTEQSADKYSFSTYVCYAPDGLFWLNLYFWMKWTWSGIECMDIYVMLLKISNIIFQGKFVQKCSVILLCFLYHDFSAQIYDNNAVKITIGHWLC